MILYILVTLQTNISMTVEDFLTTNIKPVKVNSSLLDTLNSLEEYRTAHLPVIYPDGTLAGNISYKKLTSELDIEKNTSTEMLDDFYINKNEPFIASLSKFSKHHTDIIPVVDNQKKYIGYISSHVLITELAQSPYFSEHFIWAEIQNSNNKFAISEITQIIEYHNAKNFGIIIHHQDKNTTSAYIKVQVENIESLSETFERFGYIIHIFKKENDYSDLLNDRYNNLLRYIEF